MRRHGWQGVRRQKSVRTTISDPAAERAPDLVDRQFRVPTPNVLLVADFTYVKLVTGVFVYVAFVIDAYAPAVDLANASPLAPSTPPPSPVAVPSEAPPSSRCCVDRLNLVKTPQYTLSLSGLRPSIGSVGSNDQNLWMTRGEAA